MKPALTLSPPPRSATAPTATLARPSFHQMVHKGLTLALNFVRERTPESCTRLCAVLCCLTGCSAAVGTVAFAFVHPGEAATVGALVGVTSALIAAGCVALLTRSKVPDLDAAATAASTSAVGGVP